MLNIIIANVCNAFDEAEIFEAKTLLCTIVDALNAPIEDWMKVVNTKGMPINRKSADPNQKRLLEAEDLLTMFTLLDAAKVDLPTFVAARIDRIPGFGSNMQLHGATDPAALSALVRDIVSPIIIDVIGPIATQLDKVLRRLDNIEADTSVYARLSVTDIVGKAVQEDSVPIKDRSTLYLIS